MPNKYIDIRINEERFCTEGMVKKFEHGQHRGWPGGKENKYGTKKKVTPGGCGNRNHNHEPENGGSGKASV